MPGRYFETSVRSFSQLVGVSLLMAIAVPLIMGRILGIRFNATPSAPVGFYRITREMQAPYVELCPPEPFGRISVERGYRNRVWFGCADGGARLLKRVIAVPGDLVDVSSWGISVNGLPTVNTAPRTSDSAGRPLVPWPRGRYVVQPDTVWVASTENPLSFDSRYFGPIRLKDINHHLLPLWTGR